MPDPNSTGPRDRGWARETFDSVQRALRGALPLGGLEALGRRLVTGQSAPPEGAKWSLPGSFGELFDRVTGREPAPVPGSKPPVIVPEGREPPGLEPGGSQFLESSYSNGAGSRPYKLFVPSGYRGKKVPLVVMLHGCTQWPDDFAAGTGMNELAEDRNFLVAYPAQISSANHALCWNWFNAGDQVRDQGEPSLVAGITRQIMEVYAVDHRRVYVAGLSAGGALAATLGAVYPDLYAALGIHSGLAYGAARDFSSAFVAMRQGGGHVGRSGQVPPGVPRRRSVVPAIVFHGDQDTTVNVCNADEIIAIAAFGLVLSKHVETGRSAGGYDFRRSIYTARNGDAVLEEWIVHGEGHAWSGGKPAGSFTDPRGPDASKEMLRFFFDHPIR